MLVPHFEFWGTRERDGPAVPILLERIVYRAIADLLADPAPKPAKPTKKVMQYWRRREDDRKWAFWWIFTNEDTEPCFRTICEAKGCDVDEVRERILLFRMVGKLDDSDTPFKHRAWSKIVLVDRK